MAIQIRSSELIKGFCFGDGLKKIKVGQYADDTILFLHDEDEVKHSLEIIKHFGCHSGLKLNLSKCEGFWIGSNRYKQTNCSFLGMKWPQQFRYLGIHFGNDEQQNYKLNWGSKIAKIENILQNWTKRNLSLFGKTQVIKSLALPQVTLAATLLPIPTNILKDINRLFYTFLWTSKDKIKRIKAVQSTKQGGLNMIDLESYFHALKANWVNRIMSADPARDAWIQLPLFYLKPLDITYNKLQFNIDKSIQFPQLKFIPNFYAEVIYSYNKVFVTNMPCFIDNIANEYLWGNKYITHNIRKKKNALFLRNWIRSGIRNIYHLRFIDGILDETYIYNKVLHKHNIYIEIELMKHALLPYRNSLRQITKTETSPQQFVKTNQFYTKLIEIKTNNTEHANIFLSEYGLQDEQNTIFSKKVYNEKETKLKEFNFKLLHGILPCNKNLRNWRVKDSDKCDVCENIQSIEHLLFECQYVQPLWDRINQFYNTNINFLTILGSDHRFKDNQVLTLISFLIYKEWLLLSLEHKTRNQQICLTYYKAELQLRVEIYKHCPLISDAYIILIQNIIDYI